MQRGAPASDTPVIRVIVGLRGLRGPLDLQVLQLRWSDWATAPLCSRLLDLQDHQDPQVQMELQDLKEVRGRRAIQEKMEKLVLLDLEVSQELQEVLVPKAKRASVEKVNLDPEAPPAHQDLLDQATVIAQHFSTWRDQDSQTWTECGVPVVLRAPQVLQVLLVLQWRWELTVR